jgi:hypothetical protein
LFKEQITTFHRKASWRVIWVQTQVTLKRTKLEVYGGLLNIRSDFLNAFQHFPGVSDEYEKITLDPMPKARFGEVIDGPAERFGLRLDPGLTERLVEDTAYDDALPLLAFTLKELYEKCKPDEQLSIVAHEALFRVWDRLRDWLHQDRNALRLREQIEEAARQWFEAERKYPPWSEERVIDTLEEIADSGVSLEGLKRVEVVQQFLGPTDVNELIQMLQPSMETDGGASARTYGEAWRLPLGHQARASAGVRLARLGDPRKGVGLRKDGLPDIDWCFNSFDEPMSPDFPASDEDRRVVRGEWDEKQDAIVQFLRKYDIQHFGCNHCTGEKAVETMLQVAFITVFIKRLA